eukprot:CAMPEP_0172865414 /NCGR_PEP_ID=MMETSP1075-20121228/81392_1 /TAXON_ID=2916 /ORGANISM="Ceratium fusus, Strain PA161109" /LENGTH=387 /DNA_ID=CAMNT_0013714441 /DNA_START=63 /DNA_END=1226 /DNA_ORIENTATION=-
MANMWLCKPALTGVLLQLVVPALAAEFQGAWEFIYDEPPWVFVAMWAGSAVAAGSAVLISVYTLNKHAQAAERLGFTRGRLISLGIRADLVTFLLTMPLSYSVSAAIQVFNPSMGGVMGFIRILHFSASLFKCVSLINVLGGGSENLRATLPKEPIKVFNAPPLCCLFCWPCCKRRVSREDLRIMVFAIRQFAFLAPLLTLLDILNTERRRPEDDARSISVLVLILCTTMPAMWGFNALNGLLAPMVQELHNEHAAVGIGKFVNLHMVVGKILDIVLRLAVKENYDTRKWSLPQNEWATMISGLVLCVVELILALLGMRLFPWDERMYPTSCSKSGGEFPLDTLALLQLNGVRTEEWKVFENLKPGNTASSDGAQVQQVTVGKALTD